MKIIQFQRRLMEILEQATDKDRASKICDVFITTLVLCNILSVILESVSSLQAVYGQYFDLLNSGVSCFLLLNMSYAFGQRVQRILTTVKNGGGDVNIYSDSTE